LERQRMLAEAYWDKHKAELVALASYSLHSAERGDVLFDVKGYVHPSLREMLSHVRRDGKDD